MAHLKFRNSKNRILFSVFFSSLCALFLPQSGYSMAWLQPEGHGVLINSFSYYNSCSYWDKSSTLKSGPCFRQFTFNPLVEYGLYPRLTIGINPFFRTFDQQANQTSPFSFNDSVFFARLRLRKTDWTELSTQVGYNQPYISKNFGVSTSTSSAYTIQNLQQYTDWRFLYGVSRESWYLDLESAYRNYYEGSSSELHFDFAFGYKMDQGKWIAELQELNTVSLHNPNTVSDPNLSLYTLMPSVIYWVKPKVGLQLGVKQDFAGWNVGKGTEPFFALWYKF